MEGAVIPGETGAERRPAAEERSPAGGARRKSRFQWRIWLPLTAGLLFILLWELQVFHSLFRLRTFQPPRPQISHERWRKISVSCCLMPATR
ncbi:hypothetical protein LJK87_20050 [Paenibacillus sp. P25]|nr:hypothetical protein LJK87_20050 [Paenibacillus sp. P25]